MVSVISIDEQCNNIYTIIAFDAIIVRFITVIGRNLTNVTKNNKGQALVETLLTTVMLTIITFAAIQLCIIVVNMLISNEAAFALARVAAVAPTQDDVNNNTRLSAGFILLNQVSLNNFSYLPYDIPYREKQFGNYEGSSIKGISIQLKYLSNIMFASYLSGSTLYSLGGIHLLKGSAVSPMVKSPDENFYVRAYPNAPNFNTGQEDSNSGQTSSESGNDSAQDGGN